MRTTQKKIQEKFGKIQKWYERRSSFLKWTPIGSHVNAKKIVKNQQLKISKIQKQYFCQDYWQENSEKV